MARGRVNSLRDGRIAFWVAAAVLGCFGVAPYQFEITTSFAGYWVVAREVWEGTPVVRLYDDAFLAERMLARGVEVPETFLGPPTLALTLLPLAWLSHDAARAVWLWLVCFPALLCSLWSLRGYGGRWGTWAAAVLVLSPASIEGLRVGQVYGVVLLLHCIALSGFLRQKPGLSALALAPMVAMRGWYGIPLAVGAALAGSLRTLAGTVLVTLIIALATLPLVGVASWVHFLGVQLPSLADSPYAGSAAFQTLRSFILHLTTASPIWGPDPPMHAPQLAPVLLLAAFGVICGLCAWFAVRAKPVVAFAMFTAAELLLAPVAEQYHYVLAAIPVLVALGRARTILDRGLVGVGMMLLVVPWNIHSTEWLGGWRSLLAYPRLFGLVLIVLSLAIMQFRRQWFASRLR